MYFKLVLVVASFLYILFFYLDIIAFGNGGNCPAAAHHNIGDAAINCGSVVNSTALDGREWIGDAPSKFLSGKSRSSTAAQKSFSIDPVPYKTSRISAAGFRYTFEVNPGQKFIRLHFYPASYRGFKNSVDFFTVKAGPFTLLRDFSPSLTADISCVKYIVKEFLLDVKENTKLNITFFPSHSSKSKENIYAFVNGIEIISMPTGLYYTPDGDLGARIVSEKNRFYGIDDSTALEVIHRLNIGGSSIPSVEDFGMFRRWSEDFNYLLDSGVHRVNHPALRIKYTNMAAFIAPPKLYQTSWKTGGNIRVNKVYNFTWKIPIEIGFGYLIRLHFCELDDGMAESELREFNVLINNQIAETQADVIRWSSGNGVPVYRDYMVKMKGDNGGSKCDLLIALESANKLVLGLLNGLEIFKLSNLDNSLATPNPTTPTRVSTSSSLNIKNMFSASGQSNVIVTGMTVLIILVNVIVYYLRHIWEKKFNLENDTQAATTEPSYHRFSLAEIISATENFSDAFVVGRGGFGKVYKAYIPSISETVAVKRLSSTSRQGAREFWTEIETLSKLRHIHLVSLIGYCNEGQEMILVYEYMPCGTLADNLYKMSRKGKDIDPFSWEQRLRICIGAARGLEYLHTGSGYGVIHRDVKDSNILLDKNFVAKISDFGLSKVEKVSQSKSYVSTKVKGTLGYLDPDYLTTHRLTRKSDVYSFGVVLLVVLAGKPALDTRNLEEPRSLLSCFQECIAEGDVERIVDPRLERKYSPSSLREFVKSAENCLHHQAKKRPTMAKVVASLEQALQLQQHEMTMISASGDAIVVGHHFVEGTLQPIQVIEESDVPTEGITSKPTQDLVLPTTIGKDYAPVRKSLWGWPMKEVWNRGNKQKAEGSFLESKLEGLPVYPHETLANATDHFHPDNRIGRGAFVSVYKGILLNGQEIVVKRIRATEFMNVVRFTSKLQHPNVIRLIGCCAEREKEMLIYDYMPNGNLDDYLNDLTNRELLDWNKCTIIIEGIARGLLYLHRDSGRIIIHGDLKASNILLDEGLNPKISDFRLAEILGGNQDEKTTIVFQGTPEYMAPEYLFGRIYSEKSDIYSYGVLLLEIISGKRATCLWDPEICSSLIQHAWKLWNDNVPKKLVDPALFDPLIEKKILSYVHVGLLCVQDSPNNRPNVSTVLSMLKGEIAELPRPKVPPFIAKAGPIRK